jgi:hypothetical protein
MSNYHPYYYVLDDNTLDMESDQTIEVIVKEEVKSGDAKSDHYLMYK